MLKSCCIFLKKYLLLYIFFNLVYIKNPCNFHIYMFPKFLFPIFLKKCILAFLFWFYIRLIQYLLEEKVASWAGKRRAKQEPKKREIWSKHYGVICPYWLGPTLKNQLSTFFKPYGGPVTLALTLPTATSSVTSFSFKTTPTSTQFVYSIH